MSANIKEINTLSIIFNMMKRAGKKYLPMKFLNQSQSKLFDHVMQDPKLLDYDIKLFISSEDIANLTSKSDDILKYDDKADVILLSDDQDLDVLSARYPVDDYIMQIICPRKAVSADNAEQETETLADNAEQEVTDDNISDEMLDTDIADTDNTDIQESDIKSVEGFDESASNVSDDNKKLVVNASLSDWEEAMLTELSAKYNIPDDIILEIGMTFVVNEMRAAANQQPCVINSIMPNLDNKSEQ